MPWILRTKDDLANPTLPGGVYGKYITEGRGVYYLYDGSRTRGILLISDGGKYGLDSVDSFEYKGAALTVTSDWIFHRGTYTKQISPVAITAINTGTNVLTAPGHTFVNTDQVRIGVISGDVAVPLSKSVKYFIGGVSGDNFTLSLTSGGSAIDITLAATGDMIIWAADAGFDDPDQGLPTFCPEVDTTFNNIAYVEFKLPSISSSPTDPPDWQDFRILGTGRRLMDYLPDGSEAGIIAGDDLLSNVALEIADNAFITYKVKPERFDWPSWFALRQAAHAQIWQRVLPNVLGTPTGLTGRYYTDLLFTDLLVTRVEAPLSFTWTTADLPAGMPSSNDFSVIWTGQILADFSETYTFSILHGGACQVFIDGVLQFDHASSGTHTFTYRMTAAQAYKITITLVQTDAGSESFTFSWSSASVSSALVPLSHLYPGDELIRRYECHIAFPVATEASEIHERLMDRVPGWDWTDDGGLIKFLGPDRPISFAFSFDKSDDDSVANFEKNTLIKKRRPMSDRKNFLLFRFRDVTQAGYPAAFSQADREALRKFTNGEPTNDPASDLGVATRGLADRIGEMAMVLNTDPDHTMTLSGGRASSKVRKSQFVSVSYYDVNNNYVADARYMVTFHAFGAGNEKNEFNLLPIPTPYYTDEPYTVSIPAPTLLTLVSDASTDEITGTLAVNGGTGDIHLWRKLGSGGSYSDIDNFPATQLSFTDSPGSTGEYFYKLIQDDVTGESNELSAVIDTSSPPVLSAVSYDDGANEVSGTITNSGGIGNIRIMRRIDGGAFVEIASVAPATTAFTETPIIGGNYVYKLDQDGTGESNIEEVDVTLTATAPTDLLASDIDFGDYVQVDLSWTNHGAPGNVIVERKRSGASYLVIASLDPSEASFVDNIAKLSFPRFYTYRVSNDGVAGYTNTVTVYVDSGGEL